jgi:hypothetical protein
VFIEGRGLTESVALNGGITRISVSLHNAGFGIKTGDFKAPRVWFGEGHGFARYDPGTGALEMRERPTSVPGDGMGPRLPRFWVDLPWEYEQRRSIAEVDITARGPAEVTGVAIGDLLLSTWGNVNVENVHIGHACLVKTVRGTVQAVHVTAPEGPDPEHYPTADFVSLCSTVSVMDAKGCVRMSGLQVYATEVQEPAHVHVVTPISRAA